jgi:hypothetical protein
VSEIALNRLTLSWRLDDHEGHEYEVLWFAVCCLLSAICKRRSIFVDMI